VSGDGWINGKGSKKKKKKETPSYTLIVDDNSLPRLGIQKKTQVV